ncbi:MAG: hypothetical protein ABJM29_06455 [Rhizobiaceae bacterium]
MAKSDLYISIVPRDKIANVWPKVEPFLIEAMGTVPRQTDLVTLRGQAERGEAQIWIVAEQDQALGAFTTKIYKSNRGQICSVEWLGGNKLLSWIDIMAEIVEKFARKHKCVQVEGYGRMAWLRVLKKHGYEMQTITFAKKLD